jgi:hypothetical protein
MPYYECYSNMRVELPLREKEPVNRVDRESMRYFENRERALRYAYMQEHREFPDNHDSEPEDCPVCHPELENPGPGPDSVGSDDRDNDEINAEIDELFDDVDDEIDEDVLAEAEALLEK